MRKNYFTTILICLISAFLAAQEPSGYYNSAYGKADTQLRIALSNIIFNHTNVGYGGLWTLYQTSDMSPDGKILDIYSTCNFTYSINQCGQYTVVCDCYNREHSVPNSWFGGDARKNDPIYSDGFHLYPTDGRVNGQRENYPYGECSGGTTLSGGKALGRLGNSTFAGYTSVGTVFEPDNQYKGDLARTYFYMITCYENENFTQDSQNYGKISFTYNSSSNPTSDLTAYAINLFLKWTRQDPVSQKEIDRNNAIYNYQYNRNPFIDHPELAEYIWGNKKGEMWNSTLSVENLQIEFTVSPNPAQNTLNITSNEYNLRFAIYNLNGQIMANGTVDTGQIDITNLTNGLYIIKLYNGVNYRVEKFVVSK